MQPSWKKLHSADSAACSLRAGQRTGSPARSRAIIDDKSSSGPLARDPPAPARAAAERRPRSPRPQPTLTVPRFHPWAARRTEVTGGLGSSEFTNSRSTNPNHHCNHADPKCSVPGSVWVVPYLVCISHYQVSPFARRYRTMFRMRAFDVGSSTFEIGTSC